MTLGQCVWSKIKSSNFKSSLKTPCYKKLVFAFPWTATEPMEDWPLDREGANNHAPTTEWDPWFWPFTWVLQPLSLGRSLALWDILHLLSEALRNIPGPLLSSIEQEELKALSKLIRFSALCYHLCTTAPQPYWEMTKSQELSPDFSQESRLLDLMSRGSLLLRMFLKPLHAKVQPQSVRSRNTK